MGIATETFRRVSSVISSTLSIVTISMLVFVSAASAQVASLNASISAPGTVVGGTSFTVQISATGSQPLAYNGLPIYGDWPLSPYQAAPGSVFPKGVIADDFGCEEPDQSFPANQTSTRAWTCLTDVVDSPVTLTLGVGCDTYQNALACGSNDTALSLGTTTVNVTPPAVRAVVDRSVVGGSPLHGILTINPAPVQLHGAILSSSDPSVQVGRDTCPSGFTNPCGFTWIPGGSVSFTIPTTKVASDTKVTLTFAITAYDPNTGIGFLTTTATTTVLGGSTYIQAQMISPQGNPTTPIATTDPSSKTAHVPLGSTFKVTLLQKNADGSFSPIPSTFSLSAQATVPPITVPSLFPDSVVVKYASSTDQEALLQAVHKGTATVHIMPQDTSLSPVNVGILVADPDSLGLSHPEVDSIIYPYANATGIPPQYIKAQMAQESGNQFNPTAYRYEPFSVDDLAVSRGKDLRIVNPYAFYRFATLADSEDGALPQGTQLSAADIAPRSVFQICANNACNSLVNIPNNAQFVSALEIVNMNDWYWHWTSCNGCVDRTIELYNDDFTAQTAIAASYGYMQILFTTAIAPMQWSGINGLRNPSFLLDTPENRAAGGGSVNLGTSYLATRCWLTGDNNFSADGGNLDWQDESDMRSSFEDAWILYNGDPSYGPAVSGRVDTYLPHTAKSIFGATQ